MAGSWCWFLVLTWKQNSRMMRVETVRHFETSRKSHTSLLLNFSDQIKPQAYQDSKEEEGSSTSWWEELYRIWAHFNLLQMQSYYFKLDSQWHLWENDIRAETYVMWGNSNVIIFEEYILGHEICQHKMPRWENEELSVVGNEEKRYCVRRGR